MQTKTVYLCEINGYEARKANLNCIFFGIDFAYLKAKLCPLVSQRHKKNMHNLFNILILLNIILNMICSGGIDIGDTWCYKTQYHGKIYIKS